MTLLRLLFGCHHKHLSRLCSDIGHDGIRSYYCVCLDCSKRLEIDWVEQHDWYEQHANTLHERNV